MTLRDDTWHITLLLKIVQAETFKRKELGFTEDERHTVSRVLNDMEQKGWLHRETPTSGVWHPGVITRYLFAEEELGFSEMQELDEYLEPVAQQSGITLEELKEQLPRKVTSE